MLLVIDKGIEARQRTLLVLRLVTCLGTLNENLFGLARVRILPHIAQTHTRLHLVDVLATSTAGTERVPLNLSLVDVHLKLVSLRQHSHRSSRSVHAALRLCGRHSLYTVNTRLILQRTIDIDTADGKVYLLITANGPFAHTRDRECPALGVAEALVHLKKIAGKEAGLIATRSGANLHLHVLGILRVLRYEGNLDFLLQLRLQFLVDGQLLASHFLHFRIILVGQYVLGLPNTVQASHITFPGIHDVAQVLVFFRQFYKPLLVCNDIGVSNQRRYFLKPRFQPVKFL